jgi:CubicO group peptidase (beta-lactamase class C family)
VHALDIDGKLTTGKMDPNYSIVPLRPAGAVWTSAHDLSQYVLLELRNGKLADGTQHVSAESIATRRAPQIMLGEDAHYGMALEVTAKYGTPVVHHGGATFGHLSDMIWLPEHGVGAVLLTNSDSGGRLLGRFMRKLLEVLFDGRPEADEDLATTARNVKAQIASERKRLVLPADPAEAGKLGARYANAALGEVAVQREGGRTVFDVGEWRSEVATRKNDDGSISFITIESTVQGFEFVVAEREGKRALIVRDGQHEYVFTER